VEAALLIAIMTPLEKQWVDKGCGITDQDVPVAPVTPGVVRVVCGRNQRADRFGIGHPLSNTGIRSDGACKKAVEILRSRPKKGSSADETNTCDIVGQWDHPKPPMLKQVHGDHPRRATIPANFPSLSRGRSAHGLVPWEKPGPIPPPFGIS
jgi:hypothetical protein